MTITTTLDLPAPMQRYLRFENDVHILNDKWVVNLLKDTRREKLQKYLKPKTWMNMFKNKTINELQKKIRDLESKVVSNERDITDLQYKMDLKAMVGDKEYTVNYCGASTRHMKSIGYEYIGLLDNREVWVRKEISTKKKTPKSKKSKKK